MSIDSRLREGLQRSMSAIATDPDEHLGDVRRQGRKRLVIRRTPNNVCSLIGRHKLVSESTGVQILRAVLNAPRAAVNSNAVPRTDES